MNGFTRQVATPGVPPLDPTRHVNYTLGMVLGVEDFTQEFAYLAGRDQTLAREAIGYGTTSGLEVSQGIDGGAEGRGPFVAVSAGVALSPRGELIRVPTAQCAYLNAWLAAHANEVNDRLISPPGNALTLYVTLRYRACPTDEVPIPGEPCRTEAESMAPSRLADDFILDLGWEHPAQPGEDAIRDFVQWLSQVQIVENPDPRRTIEEFEQEIRAAVQPITSPPSSPPDFMVGSPPATIQIPADGAPEYVRAAFRVWATELWPRWLGPEWRAGLPPDEGRVLLADLQVPVVRVPETGAVVIAPPDESPPRQIVLDESRRPYVLQVRALQEWLLAGVRAPASGGPVGPPPPPPAGGATPSDTVTAEDTFGAASSAGAADTFSRGDHTHGTPPEPVLDGDVTGQIGSNRLTRLQNVPVLGIGVDSPLGAENQVLTIRGGQWQAAPPQGGPAADPMPAHIANPNGHQLAGEVTGTVGSTRVSQLQGIPVSDNVPAPVAEDQVLTIKGGQWQRSPLPAAPVGEPSPNAVEHPPNLPAYQIVAAGRIRGNGTPVGPVYNNLRLTTVGPIQSVAEGHMGLTFDTYRPPSDDLELIVKVLPVDLEGITAPIVRFVRFAREGFILRVTDLAFNTATNAITTPNVPLATMQRLILMIEVSQFVRA